MEGEDFRLPQPVNKLLQMSICCAGSPSNFSDLIKYNCLAIFLFDVFYVLLFFIPQLREAAILAIGTVAGSIHEAKVLI